MSAMKVVEATPGKVFDPLRTWTIIQQRISRFLCIWGAMMMNHGALNVCYPYASAKPLSTYFFLIWNKNNKRAKRAS
jgi:hypothetical protein